MKTSILTLAFAPAVAGPALAQDKKDADALMQVDTATFAKLVASSNAFEIQSSRIVLDKLSNGPLKGFAEQMIEGHTKAGEEFKKTLEAAGKPLPSEQLAPKHVAMIKLLEGAKGDDLAMLYADMQFGAHKEAVALFKTFEKGGDSAPVQDFAAKTLPTLEMHLQHVQGMVEDKAS